MGRTYQNQFPTFGELPIDFESLGFTDDSWGNDTCPSFARNDFKVWVEFENMDDRESGGERFCFVRSNEDGEPDWETIHCRESVADALAFIANPKF